MSAPANRSLPCPRCAADLGGGLVDSASLVMCPFCAVETRVQVFPAFARPTPVGVRTELPAVDGESSCFYHPQKRAQVPCDSCGRFLCSMCDLDLKGAHFCPQCVDAGNRKGRLPVVESERTRWDQIVAALLVLPLALCWFPLPLTSIGALALIGWKWNAPPSRVSNSRAQFVVCAVVAVGELVVGTVMWWMMTTGLLNGPARPR